MTISSASVKGPFHFLIDDLGIISLLSLANPLFLFHSAICYEIILISLINYIQLLKYNLITNVGS